MSLRNNSACPTCGLQDSDSTEIIDVTQPLLELTQAIEIVDKLDDARKHWSVQACRRNINQLIKQFRYMENSLLRKRKQALQTTGIAIFRQKYRKEFTVMVKKLQKSYNVLKKLEFHYVLESVEESEREQLRQSLEKSAIHDYSVYFLFSGVFGPIKHSFWH